jgi:hypothetical protein
MAVHRDAYIQAAIKIIAGTEDVIVAEEKTIEVPVSITT